MGVNCKLNMWMNGLVKHGFGVKDKPVVKRKTTKKPSRDISPKIERTSQLEKNRGGGNKPESATRKGQPEFFRDDETV